MTTAYKKYFSSYVILKATPILIAFIWKSPAGREGGGGEVKLLLPTEVSFNALSPSSDQQQFSPNDIHTFSDLPQTLTLALYSFFEILPRGAGHSNLC